MPSDGEERWLGEICQLLRIRSVSAVPERANDVRRAAQWTRDLIVVGGGQAELVATAGHPLVIGHIGASPAFGGAAAHTVLLYAHFDVQPAGDPALWDSPPFEPTIRDGWIYARGAADDKIHLYLAIRAALDLAAEGRLPVNVRIVCDGEEEIGGDAVVRWLASDREPLAACLLVDGLMHTAERPMLVIATRGLCGYVVEVRVADRDLHSGLFGGVALNAIHVLHALLAPLMDPPGELAAGATAPSDVQLAHWAETQRGADLLASAGGRPLSPEALAAYHRVTCFTPSVQVTGIEGGDAATPTGAMPASARARVTLRLAPGQDPEDACGLLERLLQHSAPPGCELEMTRGSASRGAFTDPGDPMVQRAATALASVFGRGPALLPWGASLPIMAPLAERGIPTILTGFALHDSAVHAPNERFPEAHVRLGMEALRAMLTALGGTAATAAQS